MPLKVVFWGAPKLVSTKTLLLKHSYRRQGKNRAAVGGSLENFNLARKFSISL